MCYVARRDGASPNVAAADHTLPDLVYAAAALHSCLTDATESYAVRSFAYLGGEFGADSRAPAIASQRRHLNSEIG
jgi:hypothetical protein